MTQRKINRPEAPPAPEVPQELTEQVAKHIEQVAKQTALVPSPVRLETIKHPNGERLSARGPDGKFQRKSVASTRIATNLVSDMLLAKDEAGQTELEKIVEHIKSVMFSCSNSKDLIGLSHALKTLDAISGHEKTRNEQLTDVSDRLRQQVRTVVIVADPSIRPMEEHKPAPTQPSWAEGEVIQQNGPSGILKD